MGMEVKYRGERQMIGEALFGAVLLVGLGGVYATQVYSGECCCRAEPLCSSFFLPLTQLTSVTKDDHGCADMHHGILMMHGTAQCHDTRVHR